MSEGTRKRPREADTHTGPTTLKREKVGAADRSKSNEPKKTAKSNVTQSSSSSDNFTSPLKTNPLSMSSDIDDDSRLLIMSLMNDTPNTRSARSVHIEKDENGNVIDIVEQVLEPPSSSKKSPSSEQTKTPPVDKPKKDNIKSKIQDIKTPSHPRSSSNPLDSSVVRSTRRNVNVNVVTDDDGNVLSVDVQPVDFAKLKRDQERARKKEELALEKEARKEEARVLAAKKAKEDELTEKKREKETRRVAKEKKSKEKEEKSKADEEKAKTDPSVAISSVVVDATAVQVSSTAIGGTDAKPSIARQRKKSPNAKKVSDPKVQVSKSGNTPPKSTVSSILDAANGVANGGIGEVPVKKKRKERRDKGEKKGKRGEKIIPNGSTVVGDDKTNESNETAANKRKRKRKSKDGEVSVVGSEGGVAVVVGDKVIKKRSHKKKVRTVGNGVVGDVPNADASAVPIVKKQRVRKKVSKGENVEKEDSVKQVCESDDKLKLPDPKKRKVERKTVGEGGTKKGGPPVPIVYEPYARYFPHQCAPVYTSGGILTKSILKQTDYVPPVSLQWSDVPYVEEVDAFAIESTPLVVDPARGNTLSNVSYRSSPQYTYVGAHVYPMTIHGHVTDDITNTKVSARKRSPSKLSSKDTRPVWYRDSQDDLMDGIMDEDVALDEDEGKEQDMVIGIAGNEGDDNVKGDDNDSVNSESSDNDDVNDSGPDTDDDKGEIIMNSNFKDDDNNNDDNSSVSSKSSDNGDINDNDSDSNTDSGDEKEEIKNTTNFIMTIESDDDVMNDNDNSSDSGMEVDNIINDELADRAKSRLWETPREIIVKVEVNFTSGYFPSQRIFIMVDISVDGIPLPPSRAVILEDKHDSKISNKKKSKIRGEGKEPKEPLLVFNELQYLQKLKSRRKLIWSTIPDFEPQKVRFDTISIRQYHRTNGGDTIPKQGECCLGLEWTWDEDSFFQQSIDEFEQQQYCDESELIPEEEKRLNALILDAEKRSAGLTQVGVPKLLTSPLLTTDMSVDIFGHISMSVTPSRLKNIKSSTATIAVSQSNASTTSVANALQTSNNADVREPESPSHERKSTTEKTENLYLKRLGGIPTSPWPGKRVPKNKRIAPIIKRGHRHNPNPNQSFAETLNPIDQVIRRTLLTTHGVYISRQVVSCDAIRASRKGNFCKCGTEGLTCAQNSTRCACIKNQVNCHVEGAHFCSCSSACCVNPTGYYEFDYESVYKHGTQYYTDVKTQPKQEITPSLLPSRTTANTFTSTASSFHGPTGPADPALPNNFSPSSSLTMEMAQLPQSQTVVLPDSQAMDLSPSLNL